MNNQNLKDKIEKLEKEIADIKNGLSEENSNAPLFLPLDASFPENTIVAYVHQSRGVGHDKMFVGKGWSNYVSLKKTPFAPNENGILMENVLVDVIADLRFRLFLNAPEGFIWGAIDADGRGCVYKRKPATSASAWFSGSLVCVGRFPQYASMWKETLVSRSEDEK